ncbi:amino acid ABC transporter substrate-binding protein (PAAT family) [Microcella putealis]|uniref:Amino acid ABC transporter substrate-binding protein (PAAT family) n=1 Tax=Microcella putealis TaxID=337005 RepID=A0A4Q7LVQ8_9MICO|nr:amino acid ABC transporter substrate-binding protein (PAAT family) [Microcella putealis]TQM24142.1 amino acid ABC transporter substrate-binding protein (PAAT family) [Microcella putealis]
MTPRIRRSALAVLAASALLMAGCASPASEDGAADDAASGYVTEGKLTIATGEPAYFPYVIDDTPESGEGFEAAVAYAVAEELGFAADDVEWVRTSFEAAIQPGPKTFDVNLQQYTITEERAENVDFSSPYYATPQAVVTLESSAAASAGSLAELEDFLIGAATGTTSFTAIEQQIAPAAGAQAFNTNDDAVLALQNGQVDAIVVDLPTAFFLTGVVLDGGVLLGQLPADAGISDEWGLVLAKDSPLTDEVTAAVDRLRDSGRLAEIADEWLGADAGAPILP